MTRLGLAALTLGTLTTLTTLTTLAHAESLEVEPRPTIAHGYVSLGGIAGLDEYVRVGASLEAGFRLGKSPLFVHLMVSGGGGGELFSGGSYVLARAGVEGRHCFATSLPLCAFLGLDVGRAWDTVEHDSFGEDMSPTDEVGNLVVPRAGLELGRTIRARLAVEAPVYVPVDAPDQSVQVGGAMQLGVGYAF